MKPESWPPNYPEIYAEREKRAVKMRQKPSSATGAKAFYKENPIEFIEDWGVTYDPRNAQNDLPTTLPFVLFPRQKEFITFLQMCLTQQLNGLVEKCRDMGATWVSAAFAVWLWLFYPGSSIGFGSRKEMLVHRIGDPDSIFEKIRMFIEYLPGEVWPNKFDFKLHASYLKFINPENGSTITGEAGDQIGRGGRKLIYFKDESAHYERPERIEASLADTTNVQIDISSVCGTGTVFERRRRAGAVWTPEEPVNSKATQVFIFDRSDHPMKTDAWYEARRKKAADEGLLHIFAQEVDRDYSASVEGIVIRPEWVKAAVDAHLKIDFVVEAFRKSQPERRFAALDVADEGGDKNAFCSRTGIIIDFVKDWGSGDTAQTTIKAVKYMQERNIPELMYDSIGVGAGVKAESNRLNREGKFKNLSFVGWAGSAAPRFRERRIVRRDIKSQKIKDFYRNLKAQAWWELRTRFEKTYKAAVDGIEYPPDELVSISSEISNLYDFTAQLSQATYSLDTGGRILIDKKPDGARSPNKADACVMCFWPVKKPSVLI